MGQHMLAGDTTTEVARELGAPNGRSKDCIKSNEGNTIILTGTREDMYTVLNDMDQREEEVFKQA